MKKFKSLAALLLAVLLMIGCLGGCGQNSDNSGGNTSGTTGQEDNSGTTNTPTGKTRPTTNGQADNSLSIAIVDQIATLDPQLYTRQSESGTIGQVYEPLFYKDNNGSIVNLLIESLTENEDGSVDFTLKSDVKFHSGDTLKSEDVEYTLSRCGNSALSSALSGTVVMTVTDDTHFTWEFPAAAMGAGFQELIPYIEVTNIVNKSYAEQFISDPNEDLGMNADGTGAYIVEDITSTGDVTLKRFEDYHGEASIDTLYFKYVTGSQETAFEAGDLDAAQYGAANFRLVEEYGNVETRTQVLNNNCFNIINCTEGSPYSDIRVRQAIAYCLNRDDITSIGSDDAGSVAYNLANPLCPYWADVADHFGPDLDTANALMTEAGYSESNPLKMTLLVISAYPSWVSACEVMKEELEQSYFTVNIEQAADTSRYFTYDFDMAMIAIGLPAQFNAYASLFVTSTGMNLSGLEDADIQAAFASITDEASTQNAMKLATESLAYIPLFYNTTFFAFDGNLTPGDFSVEINGFFYREFSWK